MIPFLKKHGKLLCILFIGIAMRYAVSLMGSNYDLESYQIVGKLVASGKNVYSETYRYNYGPIWALILGLFHNLAAAGLNSNLIFRLLIITTLTTSDIAIFFWLKRTYSRVAAYWFFLNPISIYITGYHNQFDTIAIALALYSSLFLFHQKERLKVVGLVLLGLSITVKHIFIFYPLWLLLSTQKLKNKFLFLIPLFIFACSFIPFIFTPGAIEGIWTNVITYKKSTALYPFFPTGILRPFLMALPMLIAAYLFRKEKPSRQLLYYLLIIVAISPITAGQYFAIPLSAFSVLSIMTGTFFTLFTMCLFNMWGSASSTISLIPYSIIPFALCWIPLILIFFKRTKIYFNRLLFALSVIAYIAFFFYTCTTTIQYMKEQKKEFSILKVLHPAWRVFQSENTNNPHRIITGTKIEGNFKAVSNSMGFITVPFLLTNPDPSFFKKNFTVSVSTRGEENNAPVYLEQRTIAGGLSQDGLILGLPLLNNSKNKTYHVTVSSTIPKGADYITIDPFSFVQSRYFLTKSEIFAPSFILKFIFYKMYYLLSLQKTWELIYYYYVLVWGIATLVFIIKSKSLKTLL